MDDPRNTPTNAAEWAAFGHSDDVRTFLSLLVAIDGAINQIDLAVSKIDCYTPEDVHVKIARCFDGLDGEEDVGKLRAALEVLLDRHQALGGADGPTP